MMIGHLLIYGCSWAGLGPKIQADVGLEVSFKAETPGLILLFLVQFSVKLMSSVG